MYGSKLDKSSDSSSSYSSCSERKNYKNYSRSRSPISSYKKQDFQKRRTKLVKGNEELYQKKLELLDEKKRISSEIKELRKAIDGLKTTLEGYKVSTMIFLPCSHQKQVNIKYKQLLDNTLEKAIEKLSDQQLKNEIVIRQLRSKIFYSMEANYPEVFKCTYVEKYTTEPCGHIGIAECHEIKKIVKTSQYPLCTEKTDVTFDCGHCESIECCLKASIRCSRCL